MKTHINLSADSNLVIEAKGLGLNLSKLFQEALEDKLQLVGSSNFKKTNLYSQLDEKSQEVQIIKNRIQREEESKLTRKELEDNEKVQAAISKILENKNYFEGQLRLLKNSSLNIDRGMLRELVDAARESDGEEKDV